MKRNVSIGVVLFRRDEKGEIVYLLLKHFYNNNKYWNFPKGHPEATETELETARRETREETGITDITIIDGFRDSYQYDFMAEDDGKKHRVFREVIFYLGETKQVDVTISDEHTDFGWFDYKTALKRSYFPESKKLLRAAHDFLLKHLDSVV